MRQLSAAMASIPYADLAVVALAYRAEAIGRPLDGYGYLVTRQENLSTLGVLWESSIFPNRAPAGCVLLRAMLGGARRPEVSALDDDRTGRTRREGSVKVLAPAGAAAAPVDLPVAVGDRAVHRRSRRAHRHHPAAGRRAPRAACVRHRI